MTRPPVLYQETRLTPTPSSPSSILQIDVAGTQSTSLLRAGNKRPFDAISGLDEESYSRKHLATEGSVFFRSKARSPRSFLWRILEDRKILEIQSVDLLQERKHEKNNSWLTFQVALPAPIVRNGAAFADPEETDALEIFLLTESHALFTITLRNNLLTRETVPLDFDSSSVVKKYTSASLSVRHPYRVVAVNSLELLVTLADGGILQLQRKASESGAQWRETQYSAGGWAGSIRVRGIFGARQSIKFGDLDLDTTAVTAIAKSPNGKFIWTVSLDHWLKAWSVKTGKVVYQQDLLNEVPEGDAQKKQSYIMSAEQGTLLQVVTTPTAGDSKAMARMDEDGVYYLVIHSPKEHRFKFYAIRGLYSSVVDESIDVEDLQQSTRFIPPVEDLLNTNVWHLEHFSVKPGPDWQQSQLWVHVRSGALCSIFMLDFSLVDDTSNASGSLTEQWQTGWTIIDAGLQTPEELKHTTGYPGGLVHSSDSAVTPTERWLQYLFYPGRFAVTSLEAALSMYCKGRGLPRPSGGKLKGEEQALEERLTTAISSKLILRRLPSEQPDHARYQRDVQEQWEVFYSLLSHIHERRQESIGFALDVETALPWTVCADFVAPVRAYDALEQRVANTHLLSENANGVSQAMVDAIYSGRLHEDDSGGESAFTSQLMVAASAFKRSLSTAAQIKLADLAARQALEDHAEASQSRALTAYETCGFDAEVSDDAFEALNAAVEGLGGLGSLSDTDFLTIGEWLQLEGKLSGHDAGSLLDRYGAKFVVQLAQETLQQAQSYMLDLLALVIFMAGGLERDELDPSFKAEEVYDAITYRLRHVQLLLWLTAHTREEPVHAPRKTLQLGGQEQSPATRRVTILEDLFIGDWSPLVPAGDDTDALPLLLTKWSKAWALGADIDGDERWSEATANILAHLIKHKEQDLAIAFLPFTAEHAWSQYLKARLHLMTGDYTSASLGFRRAAEEMASITKIGAVDKTYLLSPEERNSFGHGLSAYFQHITGLYEKLKAYSYVGDFGQRALEALEDDMPDFGRSLAELDRKRSKIDSPAMEQVDHVLQETQLLRWKVTKDEILNRMFNAYVQTARFPEAYDALKQIDNPPIQRANMKRLIDSSIKQDAIPTLLAIPFSADLASEADKALFDLAKKELDKGTSSAQIPFYQILYAFRTQRGDFRGAAEILYEQLERMRAGKQYSSDPEDERLLDAYVLLINTLACCGPDDAWLLSDRIEGVHAADRKRKLVTLADIRREYTAEMDRLSDLQHGRFALLAQEEDVEML